MQLVTTNPTQYKMVDHDRIVDDTRYVLRVRDMPIDEKPREKLLKYGLSTLSMAELVAVLWGVGTRKEDVLEMSHRVLKEYGERAILYETDPMKLADALMIPKNKAYQLVAGLELGRRYFDKRGERPVFVRTSRQAWQYLSDMGMLNKEQLRGLYLNSRYQLVHEETISVGSLTSNVVHPREVFQPALERGAVAVIIAHNHPSGDVEPTQADLETTSQLRAGGAILGIELLDHLIVTKGGYKSLLENAP
ncbi:DNA repair protein RadC [Candidatus Saccharibacteria bacterium]|nr:DNA repair protein RadC [Candidatus Saccharibacteria bacterium]